MKYLVTLLLVIGTFGSYAQKSETFFIGNWKVVDVVLPKGASSTDKKVLTMLKPPMLKTTFSFQPNHKGICRMTIPGIGQETTPSPDVYWTYNPENQRLSIQEWKNRKGFLAEFIVNVEDGGVSFALTDGPMILKVKKVN
jgi:hypothetical protein